MPRSLVFLIFIAISEIFAGRIASLYQSKKKSSETFLKIFFKYRSRETKILSERNRTNKMVQNYVDIRWKKE